MHRAEDLLIQRLQAAPRRYRMPPLPADPVAAAAAGPDTALAFAIEARRAGVASGTEPAPAVAALFTAALADLIRRAIAPDGDPAFQALVLRNGEPPIREYVALLPRQAADRRAVRSAVDAVAHPARPRDAGTPWHDDLARLHALAAAQDWPALRATLDALAGAGLPPPLHATLATLRAGEPLRRLARAHTLAAGAAVRRYLALRGRHGPAAGSEAAAAQGRASARAGDDAEQATGRALDLLAAWLQRQPGANGRYRVAHSLRPPPGFPGETGKAKDEWDAALLHQPGDGGARVVLLVEVKASPAAATPDLARLHRGLLRLAQAQADASHAFASANGAVLLAGASLRALAPRGRTLPPRVLYSCTAAPEARPPVLAAAARAVLLAEPASLAFAAALQRGEAPAPDLLLPVWRALADAPRLRSALHQYDTARQVREAMLHPDDMAATVRTDAP